MQLTLASSTMTALLLLSSQSFALGTYKCTSPSGDVQYTAVPPAGYQCEELTLRKAPANSQTMKQAAPKSSGTNTPQNQTDDPNFDRIAQENCEKSQRRLTTLNSNPRVRIKEGNKYRVLSEEERQEKIQLATLQVEQYCK